MKNRGYSADDMAVREYMIAVFLHVLLQYVVQRSWDFGYITYMVNEYFVWFAKNCTTGVNYTQPYTEHTLKHTDEYVPRYIFIDTEERTNYIYYFHHLSRHSYYYSDSNYENTCDNSYLTSLYIIT